MQLIPTHCDGCWRTVLTSADELSDGAGICQDCGAAMHALPGESYIEQDRALFAEITSTLREAGLTPCHAALLVNEFEARELLSSGRCLRHLVQVLPSLAALEPLVGGEPGALRKAEGMLITVLEAMARSRTKSDVAPATGASSAKAVGDS